jgi:hypothetical protein
MEITTAHVTGMLWFENGGNTAISPYGTACMRHLRFKNGNWKTSASVKPVISSRRVHLNQQQDHYEQGRSLQDEAPTPIDPLLRSLLFVRRENVPC